MFFVLICGKINKNERVFTIFIFIILLNCIPFFQGEDTVSNTNDLHKSVNGINVVFLFVAKSILAPIVEEVTFRGLIYSKLKLAFPIWVSSLLVSLTFGVIHFSSSIFTVLSAILLSLIFIEFDQMTQNAC